jgi:glycosyltransferase involved in cell wall biosynthesis
VQDELPVVELVNNWAFRRFEETYRSAYLDDRVAHVLRAVQPDVVHVHNLLNLTWNLPSLARRHGARVVATLHDYTLVCPSGGQRLHLADEHECREIDPGRCARCFAESPFGAQLRLGGLRARGAAGLAGRAAAIARARAPRLFDRLWRIRPRPKVTSAEIAARLNALPALYEELDCVVAPSRSLADEMIRFGLPAAKIQVRDYGFEPMLPAARSASGRLRIGFAGTIAWHKGVHVLLAAAAMLPQDRIEVRLHGDPDTFPGYGAALRKAAPASVKWMGAFDQSRAADVFAGIDVLVVPSLWPENSPLVIHEAFMAGVPVVAARAGGIPDLVEEGVSGLLYEPRSAASLAACLSRLMGDPGYLGRLSSSRPRVLTIQEDADAWERIYDACVTSPSSS